MRGKYLIKRFFRPQWIYSILRSVKPWSDSYGKDRGKPLDRYYIKKFLSENQDSITGKCLEVRDDRYTKKFGRRVSSSDIVDIDRKNKKATIFSDLRNMKEIQDNTYDCILLTQVLQFIDEFEKALRECRRILKPGGVILATVPAISRIDVASSSKGDFWRFTESGARYAFKKYFGEKVVSKNFGNCLSGYAFWIGLCQNEIPKRKLDFVDPNFPVIIGVRATK